MVHKNIDVEYYKDHLTAKKKKSNQYLDAYGKQITSSFQLGKKKNLITVLKYTLRTLYKNTEWQSDDRSKF